jgi:hypothetical protein
MGRGLKNPRGIQSRVWRVGVRVWVLIPFKNPYPYGGYEGSWAQINFKFDVTNLNQFSQSKGKKIPCYWVSIP